MPTGSVSMMTLLLAIIKCHAGFVYNTTNGIEFSCLRAICILLVFAEL